MRRDIHIAIALTAVLLLVRPLDCLGMSLEAADCCIKGKCFPTVNSDDCCKGALPYGTQLIQTDTKDTSHWLQVLDVVTPEALGPILGQFRGEPLLRIHAPPGSPPGSRLNLPLLI